MNNRLKFIFLFISSFVFFALISTSFSFLNVSSTEKDFVVDSLGRKVPLLNYKRIGVINPAALKSFIFLGLSNDRIVAADSYSIQKYSFYLSNNTFNLGDFNNPNLEIIVKNNIDILILDQSFPIQKLYEIEKLKIPYFVYSTSPSSYDAIYQNLYNLSRIIKKEKECEKLYKENILTFENQLLKLKNKFNGKSILIVVWADKNLTCAGIDSYISFMAEFAGFKNSIKEKGWINISFERLLLLDPDYIIVASSLVDKNFFNDNIFKSLKAVVKKSYYFFNTQDEDVILQPSFDLWKGFWEILSKMN